MFSALFKAFTGRAGLLAGVLSLLIAVVIFMAVKMGMPRIEQKVASLGQAHLSQKMTEGDMLSAFEAKGRDLYIDAGIQNFDAIQADLADVSGVRNVLPVNTNQAVASEANDDVSPEVAVVDAQTSAAQAVANPSVDDAADSVANAPADEAPITEAEQPQAEPALVAESNATYDESSLSLRYDGTQLALTGHLSDAQLVALVTEDVQNLVPEGSQLTVNVDAQGALSNLNWIDRFLEVVQGLPNDAQGIIQGSDTFWVQVFPDAEQTLVEASQNASVQVAQSTTGENTNIFANVGVSNDDANDVMGNVSGDVAGSDNSNPFANVGVNMQSQTLGQAIESNASIENAAGGDIFANADASAQSDQGGDASGNVFANVDVNAQSEQSAQGSDGQPVDNTLSNVFAGVDVNVQSNQPAEPKANSANSEMFISGAPSDNTQLDAEAYILHLNKQMAVQHMFESGEYRVSNTLANELNTLANVMRNNPNLLLRIVGNLDFSVDQRNAEYVGMDRARSIRNYLREQGVEPFRLFAAPLPRDSAFAKRVQVVFYISQ
ncbi:MAG: OmpA family protein [Arenicellales bacterium]